MRYPPEEPQRYADERVHELQDAPPKGSRGRVTRGVGIAEDENGVLRPIIGTTAYDCRNHADDWIQESDDVL